MGFQKVSIVARGLPTATISDEEPKEFTIDFSKLLVFF